MSLGVANVVDFITYLPELVDLARSRKTRVIHGLEHATIAILNERGIRTCGGETREGRFKLYFSVDSSSEVSAGAVREATEDAIERIDTGEIELAYSDECGTSARVASLLWWCSTIIAAILGLGGGLGTVPTVLFLAGVASIQLLLLRPLGILAQRLLTVSTDVRGAKVGDGRFEIVNAAWLTHHISISFDTEATSKEHLDKD